MFWFEGEVLCTRENGVLEGITRETVFEINPFVLEFKKIEINQLLQVDEVFLTQTTNGIVPVVEIDGEKIGSGELGGGILKN